MNPFFRWLGQQRFSVMLLALALGLAALVKSSKGTGLMDLVWGLSLPWHADGQVQQQLIDAQVEAMQQQLQELEAQNQSLKTLVDLPALPERKKIVAPVIARGSDNWWQAITLGKGSKDGIAVNDVVMAPGGLVGRVTEVTPTTSLVLLVTDPSSNVGVTITRNRKVGILKGQLDRYGKVEFFEKNPEVKVNDAVVSSHLSSIFPPGIPIGRIAEVEQGDEVSTVATVTFTVPLDTLEWVSVLVHG